MSGIMHKSFCCFLEGSVRTFCVLSVQMSEKLMIHQQIRLKRPTADLGSIKQNSHVIASVAKLPSITRRIFHLASLPGKFQGTSENDLLATPTSVSIKAKRHSGITLMELNKLNSTTKCISHVLKTLTKHRIDLTQLNTHNLPLPGLFRQDEHTCTCNILRPRRVEGLEEPFPPINVFSQVQQRHERHVCMGITRGLSFLAGTA